jgi:hypothetical protein
MNEVSSRNTRPGPETIFTPSDRYLCGLSDPNLDNHHQTSQIGCVAEAFRVGTAGFDPCSLHRVTKR